MSDYNAAKTPVDHVASNFPTTCDSCHKFSDATWMHATFSHTAFPLVGVHATTACATCHNPPYAPSANNYTAVPTSCYGCHVRDFTGATSPVPHTGFADDLRQLPQEHGRHLDAEVRLQPRDVLPARRRARHGALRPVPQPALRSEPNNYLTVPTTPCSACHQTDYNNAKSPVDHVASRFPTTCDSCHKFSDATWMLATFSHTTFPLVGVHATTACAICHNPPYAPSANNTTDRPDDLLRVPRPRLQRSPRPRCSTRDSPTTCDSCHKNTDATWSQKSAFNHATYFPLAGAHTTAPCSQCHS